MILRKILFVLSFTTSLFVNAQTVICKVSNKPYVDPGYKITINGDVTNVLCQGENTGSITATATGGKAPYKYYWNIDTISKKYCYCEDDDIGVYVFSTKNTISNLKALTYRLKVVDANGITVQRVFSISEPKNKLNVKSSNSNPICSGDKGYIYLTKVEGGVKPYQFLWSDSSRNQNLVATSGIYSVVVTDSNGCKVTLSDTITDGYKVKFTPIFSYENKKFNFEVTKGKSPFVFSVYNSQNKVINNTDLYGGNYRCKITDANGCTDQTIGFIKVKDSTVNIDILSTYDNFRCYDGVTKINNKATGGKEPYLFEVFDGNVKIDENNVKAGTYTIKVKDANGFEKQDILEVKNTLTEINIEEDIQKSSTNISNDGYIHLKIVGGTQPYSYKWDSGSTEKDQNNIIFGDYSISIKDNNGCMMNKNIHVDFESKISDNNLDSVDTYLEDSYPNPYFSDSYSSNKIVIGYKTPANSTSYIYVYNQSGNLVQTFNVKSNENKIEFDINSLKSGLYTYVLVVNNVSVFTKKITIL